MQFDLKQSRMAMAFEQTVPNIVAVFDVENR